MTAAAAGITLLLAGSAHAVTYREATVDAAPNTAAYATVECSDPSQTLPLSGGVEVTPGHNNSYLKGSDISLAPGGGVDGWAGWTNAQAPVSVTVHVACTKADVIYAFGDRQIQPSSVGTIKARCPRGTGTEVAGGGFNSSITGFGTVEALASMPFDGRDADHRPNDGWRVKLKNLTVSQAFTGGATATCVGGNLAKALRYFRTEITLISDGVQYGAYASCRGEQEIVGGGFEVGPIPEAVNVHSSYMVDGGMSGIDEDLWWNQFDSFSNETQYASSYAVCRAG